MDLIRLGPSILDSDGIKWVDLFPLTGERDRVLLKDPHRYGPWEALQEEITQAWLDWFTVDLEGRTEPYRASLRASVKSLEETLRLFRDWYYIQTGRELDEVDYHAEFLKILDLKTVDWEDLSPMESSLYQTLVLQFAGTLHFYVKEMDLEPDLIIPTLFNHLAHSYTGIVWSVEPVQEYLCT